jgi:beta-amylase
MLCISYYFHLSRSCCRYDDYAFERIAESAFGRNARAGRLEQVTFLRMGDLMFDNWDAFSRFLNRMRCKI